MARYGWSMTGNRELEEYYRGLPRWVREEVLEDTVVSGALILANAVKRIARDKKILLTGTLIRSYHIGGHMMVTPDALGGQDYSDIGGIIKGGDSYSVLIGTNLPYARRQEFGFETEDSRGRTYHQPARPHLREAFDTQKAQVKDEMVDTFRTKLMAHRAA